MNALDTTRFPLCLATLVAVTLLGFGSSRAEAAFDPPIQLDAGNSVARFIPSGFAFDSSGTASVAWLTDGLIRTRQVAPDGTPGPIFELASDDPIPPRLVIDDEGRATIVWEEGSDVTDPEGNLRAVRLSPSGVPGPVIDLDQPGLTRYDLHPQVAVDDSGRVTVVWSAVVDGTRRIVADRITPDGEVLPSVIVSSGGGHPTVGGAALAVNAKTGAATVAWRNRSGETVEIRAARLSPGGEVRQLGAVSGASRLNAKPVIASSWKGPVTIAWLHQHGRHPSIQAAQLRPKGEVGDVLTVTKSDNETYFARLRMAADEDARCFLTWQRFRHPTAKTQVGVIGRTGKISKIRNTSREKSTYNDQMVVADRSEGGATIAWWAFRSGDVQLYATDVSESGAVLGTDRISGPPFIEPYFAIADDRERGPAIVWGGQDPVDFDRTLLFSRG